MGVLSRESLRAAYDFLRTTPPFDKWNLPPGEAVVFHVGHKAEDYGLYEWRGRRHHLTVHRGAVRTNLLVMTVAHEMIHLHMRESRVDRGGEHNATFHRLADRVCRIHGWPRERF